MNLFERFEVLEDPRDIRGKKYKLMSDIKVSENSQKIYKNKFLKSINFNNHVIYPSDGYYYCGYQSWGSY